MFFQNRSKSTLSRFLTLDYAAHLHAAVEMGYLEKGEVVAVIEGVSYPIRAGDFFVIFPNLIHSYEKSRDAQGYLAIIKVEDLSPYFQILSDSLPASPVLPSGSWEESGLDTIFSHAFADHIQERDEVMQGYFQVLFGKCLRLLRLSRITKPRTGALREILSYINSNNTGNMTRKSIARALGMSESTVSHVFSDTLKMSLPHYLNALRLSEAAKLLEQTDLGVTEIAARAGFGSIRSFNRAFQESYGCRPSEYRKKKV